MNHVAYLVFLFAKDPERGSMENRNNEYDTNTDYDCNSFEESRPPTSSIEKMSTAELRMKPEYNNCENMKVLLQTPSFILLLC